jgi:glycosyltransferase involved in cell wall biosynthesis
MTRVLWVAQVYPRGEDDFLGAFLHRLARELPGRGFAVRVICPHADGIPEEEERDGVSIRRFRYAPPERETLAYTGEMHRAALRRPLRFAAFLRSFRGAVGREIRSNRPGLVHAHWWIPSGMVATGAARAGIPLCVSIHGTDLRLAAKNPLARVLARRVLSRAARVLPVSRALRREIERLSLTRAPIEVLSMPADSEVFRPLPGSPRDAEPPSFVVAARLTAQKRVDVTLRAAARLAGDSVPFRLHVVGDGPERRPLEALSRGLALGERVVFHGAIASENLARLLRAASAVILSSEGEGYGLTLVEGALCGTPGIGVRSGGIEELIDPGVTGLLAAPGDDAALAGAIRTLATDARAVAEMGRKARERMQALTPGAVADRLAAIYGELAAGAGVSPGRSKSPEGPRLDGPPEPS